MYIACLTPAFTSHRLLSDEKRSQPSFYVSATLVCPSFNVELSLQDSCIVHPPQACVHWSEAAPPCVTTILVSITKSEFLSCQFSLTQIIMFCWPKFGCSSSQAHDRLSTRIVLNAICTASFQLTGQLFVQQEPKIDCHFGWKDSWAVLIIHHYTSLMKTLNEVWVSLHADLQRALSRIHFSSWVHHVHELNLDIAWATKDSLNQMLEL